MGESRPSKWRLAWTAGRLAGRRVLGRAESGTDQELAEALTEQLDSMKGLAMKVGQIVSYMDVPLPSSVQQTMAKLQTGAVAMTAAQVRAQIESSLHAPLEATFVDFEWTPVAAASIGQVHRARLARDGRRVAVKVQYPSVRDSFRDDLRTVDRLAGVAALASAVDGRALVGELAARLQEECDYPREARMQEAFRTGFLGRDGMVIPAVMTEQSAAAVLTTEWIDGLDFEAFRASASASARRRAAETLVRFSYESLLRFGTIQADPHPGNFLFRADGTVVFLDFGCVRELDHAFVVALRDMIEALDDLDHARFAIAIRTLGLVGKPRGFDDDHFFEMMLHLHRPLFERRFEFTSEYVRRGYAYNGPTNPNARTMAMPPAYIWVARLQWGLWSILARLGAVGAFRPILREILAVPPTPLDAALAPRVEVVVEVA